MVEDSFTFADWAKSYTKHGNEIMCSLDVTSLFANVPLDETIPICLDKLYFLPDPQKQRYLVVLQNLLPWICL